MKTAFLTEMGFSGKVPIDHRNMRTEFAWMATLESDHFNLFQYEEVKNYDVVFIIFPKALVKVNMIGIEMTYPPLQRDFDNIKIYSLPVVETLKKNNKKVCYIQEGPSYVFNDYDMVTQFNFYNQLAGCDIIFAHNTYDTHFYKGLFPQTKIVVIPSLVIADRFHIPDIIKTENKAMIGGNFCHWYGGFQSYIVATEFQCPIFVPSSHCKRTGEEQVPNLTHLPWVMWEQWMQQLSTFKYAVNLMPTVAAGTFSLNCACFGIPCIGNEKVDTQAILFPELSVDVNDIHAARHLAIQLREDREFYEHIGHYAKTAAYNTGYANPEKWMDHMKHALA